MSHVERVQTEYTELCTKVTALEKFLSSDKTEDVHFSEIMRLELQLGIMKSYVQILEQRLAFFGMSILSSK